MNTLKHLISSIAFIATVSVATAQDYSNIEFIENKGQWDPQVKFKGDVKNGAVFVRSTGFTFLQHNTQDFEALMSSLHVGQHSTKDALQKTSVQQSIRSHAYNVDFVGASPKMQVVPDKKISTYNNYFIGNDPSKWATECNIYQAVTLQDVYPNIDVRYYTNNGTLKYDIIVKPGADPRKIALKYDGVDKIQVKNKELVVGTSVGEMRESYPYTYQPRSHIKERQEIQCKYVVTDNIVRFDIKNYDPSATLVIDPSLIFCTLAGSTANNWGFTATYGPDGSFFGGGIVFGGNTFPVTPGAFQTSWQGGNGNLAVDIGILKLSPNGRTRIYGTYLGGAGNEQPHSLICDGQGNLYIAGRTNSPVSGIGAYPNTGIMLGQGGGYDIIVTELNARGSGLIASRRIGGAKNDGVNIKEGRGGTSSLEQNYGDDGRSEVMLDGANNVYIASCTQSDEAANNLRFPATAGAFQPAFGGGLQDGVLIKFSPSLANLAFASFLGGSRNDAAYVVSVASTGDIYVGGGTESPTYFNNTGTINPTLAGDIDGFVIRISNDGTSVINKTYAGTTDIDQVYGLKLDRFDFPYITGQTRGAWTVFNAAYSNPNSKQFICKLQPDLSAYVYSTVFGNGSALPNISPTALLVDRCENVYVSGWGGLINTEDPTHYPNSGTRNLPVTADNLGYPEDGRDFYFFVLKKNAVSQLYGSTFGQNGGFVDHVDGGTSRFDQNGVIYQAVCANCGGNADFPITPGGLTRPPQANCNLGMIKISFNLSGVGSDVESAIGGVANDSAGCVPLDVVFTDQVRNAQQYIWNFGDGSPDVGPLAADVGYTQTHTYNSVGTFRAMLVAIDPNSCNIRDTSYINIRVGDVKANLAATFAKTGECTALSYQFTNTSTSSRSFTDTSFIWDFGDGSPRVVAGMNPVIHTFPAVGSYNVRLILNDTSYCNNPDSLLLTMNVAANVKADFVTDPTGCAPYTAVFKNTSIGGVTWEWDFGDPASGADNTSTVLSPTHLYAVPGTYTVSLVANDPNTCNKTDRKEFVINVYEKPDANFSYSPLSPIVNTPNIFTNLSSPNAVRFKWLFGDGDSVVTTSRADLQHQYNSTGTFNACLVAYNALGCPDMECKPVDAIIEPLLDVPNAFTPNSGDVNSVVMARGFGIAKIKFIIYNRWGQKVFETSNRLQGWNGRVKGVVQPMDVYAYTLEVEFFDGTKATKKGDITLIR